MENQKTLTDLKIGQIGNVLELLSKGSMRRRLQDLGVIEGTKVECLHKSPAGDPIAYLIRGAAIALRSEDSSNILVSI
ncbi:MAG: FeoA family protein [Oscillospiraceae bacterium]